MEYCTKCVVQGGLKLIITLVTNVQYKNYQ